MVKKIKEILKVFADNGLFEEGVELIGSWCFKLYQDYLEGNGEGEMGTVVDAQ
jgi:hypothetical protein